MSTGEPIPGRAALEILDSATLYEDEIHVRSDEQRWRVYQWEDELLGRAGARLIDAAPTRASARETALSYLSQLWETYSGRFHPLVTELPRLRLGSLKRAEHGLQRRSRGAAGIARVRTHCIYLSPHALYRETLVHEVVHLLEPRDRHGPDFCTVALFMWEREFGVDRACALDLAHRHSVRVNPYNPVGMALDYGTPPQQSELELQ